MKKTIVIGMALLLVPVLVFAWDGTPRIVAGVTSTPLLVAAAPDDGYGAFVAWQEPSATTPGAGTLRVLRLTPEGDANAAWPAGGIVIGGGEAVRSAARLLPDGAGGAYAWWLQGTAVRLTRVLGSGAIAPGWTAAGRSIGSVSSADHRPWVQADGQGGVWIGCFQGTRALLSAPTIRIAHLGPDGLGAGGWPSTPRGVALSPDDDEWVYSASFAPAADGGAWVLVATGHVVNEAIAAGEWRLARLTPAGLSDPARPLEGDVVAPFDATQVGLVVPRIGLGAVADDGAGGVFAVIGAPASNGDGSWNVTPALRRLLADGTPHAQQPGPGSLGWWYEQGNPGCSFNPCGFADYSAFLQRDAAGELFAGACQTYTEVGYVLEIQHLAASGTPVTRVAAATGAGIAVHPDVGGGFVLATFDPTGPTHQVWDPTYACAGLYDTKTGFSYSDQTFSPYSSAYTGSDAAPLPDGSAVLVWAHALSPTGLYAVRVGANGSALDAGPPPVAARGLRLVREGAQLRASWGPGAEGTLRLLDVAGRERARMEVASSGGAAVLARGGELSPGVYFARLVRRDGTVERARGVVLP